MDFIEERFGPEAIKNRQERALTNDIAPEINL